MGTVYTISAAAAATGYGAETLRRLEERGIIQPIRDSAGRRLYTDADLEVIRDHRDRQRRVPALSP